jgi:hypothetical protein
MTLNILMRSAGKNIVSPLKRVDEELLRRSSLLNNPRHLDAVLYRARNEIRPMVLDMLMENFEATNLGKVKWGGNNRASEGLMRKAVENARVLVIYRRGLLFVRIKAPDDMTGYEGDKRGSEGFYKAFAAQNYGAVHGATATRMMRGKRESILGKRAKMALKRQLTGKDLHAVSESRLGRKLVAIEAETGKKVGVRKGHHFFQLSPSQLTQVNSAIMQSVRMQLTPKPNERK